MFQVLQVKRQQCSQL